jgi:hypothetical protein
MVASSARSGWLGRIGSVIFSSVRLQATSNPSSGIGFGALFVMPFTGMIRNSSAVEGSALLPCPVVLSSCCDLWKRNGVPTRFRTKHDGRSVAVRSYTYSTKKSGNRKVHGGTTPEMHVACVDSVWSQPSGSKAQVRALAFLPHPRLPCCPLETRPFPISSHLCFLQASRSGCTSPIRTDWYGLVRIGTNTERSAEALAVLQRNLPNSEGGFCRFLLQLHHRMRGNLVFTAGATEVTRAGFSAPLLDCGRCKTVTLAQACALNLNHPLPVVCEGRRLVSKSFFCFWEFGSSCDSSFNSHLFVQGCYEAEVAEDTRWFRATNSNESVLRLARSCRETNPVRPCRPATELRSTDTYYCGPTKNSSPSNFRLLPTQSGEVTRQRW